MAALALRPRRTGDAADRSRHGAGKAVWRVISISQQRNAYWRKFAHVALNTRQQKVLNRLFEDSDGYLTARKWAAIAKTSADTALRDITALVDAGMLVKAPAGGRSSAYEISAEFR